METVEIHPRVFKKHPQLSEEDILAAFENAYYEALRQKSPNFPEYLWLGQDTKGRDIEMVGTMKVDGWLIYHANTPLSKRVKDETKKGRR